MKSTIRLGISTCPNDTFTFHALMHRLVDWRGLDFQVELLDIQQLNDRLFADAFDVAKCSFHAALLLADRTIVLPSGSALGYGVGPLLLSADVGAVPERSEQLTLCPGQHTTAAMLFRLFYPATTSIRHVVFSDIMPRLQDHEADFGVCIHEGRFTWQDQGLGMVADLGTRWESEHNCPLPLGGLVASRRLDDETIAGVSRVILDSLQYSLSDPAAALPTMRQYAQEFNDDVLRQHVDLYVNDWTVDLGKVGRGALETLSAAAKSVGLVGDEAAGIEVFEM
ncbi:1,4-dihydroxy-6-naphthoate synthase [Stieleria varia]|uniref:1,4-dihydroxy-6-naphtoate synthase n=1 Tax=Stieleria varia TaxID=2528005 RepID=A0A5C6AQ11_9BACT|nr:1,4-dihydroxy-6-naphthoate synthase [Stieleria varia]TWU01319.1 1,4-dihydroxy-6-naphtoate synthase [Stieleria varia]